MPAAPGYEADALCSPNVEQRAVASRGGAEHGEAKSPHGTARAARQAALTSRLSVSVSVTDGRQAPDAGARTRSGRASPASRVARIASTMWSMSASVQTSGGRAGSSSHGCPWPGTPRRAIPLAQPATGHQRGVDVDPAHSPRWRIPTTPCPSRERRAVWSSSPSRRARSWNSPVLSMRTTSCPIAQASGLPPKVTRASRA